MKILYPKHQCWCLTWSIVEKSNLHVSTLCYHDICVVIEFILLNFSLSGESISTFITAVSSWGFNCFPEDWCHWVWYATLVWWIRVWIMILWCLILLTFCPWWRSVCPRQYFVYMCPCQYFVYMCPRQYFVYVSSPVLWICFLANTLNMFPRKYFEYVS